MIILNFTHPLTDAQREQIVALTTRDITRVVDLPVQLDHDLSFEEQIRAIVSAVALTAVEWQKEPLLVNLPGYAPAAASVLAELHGRIGHFPPVLRLRPVADSVATLYEVAEIINLRALRDRARHMRGEGEEA